MEQDLNGMNEESLDFTTVETLKDVLEEDFTELIETFIEDAHDRIIEMREILANAPSQLEMPAHTLKGSSGNIGAVKLSQLCSQLVDSVREGKTEELAEVVDEIATEYEVLIPQLNSLI